tara:strand:- start:1696 stop:2577 length:882 start_codon:yes stop_codon:yes gene_type:complete
MGLKSSYEKNWKKLMILPIAVMIISLIILGNNYAQTGEFIERDITLKGGVLLTVESSNVIDISDSEQLLEDNIGEQVRIRELKSLGSANIVGYSFEYAGDDVDALKSEVSNLLGDISSDKMSLEEISSAISERFWQGTIRAISIAILLMSVVVFLYFRLAIPALAIILSGVSNIIGVLAVMTLLGMNISTSGIAAILMLLGYSIDSNIVLTARVLHRKELELNDRILSAIKTGLTMSVTSIVALFVLFLASPAAILKVISGVLIIGLLLDLMNTWIQNAGILRWYFTKRGVKR